MSKSDENDDALLENLLSTIRSLEVSGSELEEVIVMRSDMSLIRCLLWRSKKLWINSA